MEDTEPTIKTRLVTPLKLIGEEFAGRYTLVSIVGGGASSSVFEAVDKQTNKTVAIKVLHAHLSDLEDVKMRFEREARTATALSHPNIVRVIDQGTTDGGQPFLVMEFAGRVDLLQHLHSCGNSLGEEDAINIFLQICAAVSIAHEKRIIHRDLKPQNVMVDTTSGVIVKVLDFGIAKLIGNHGDTFFKLPQSGETLGSLLYMSPEQCLDEDVDERSDIYAIGCLMYEVLMGKPPHSKRTAFETMNAQISEQPDPFRITRPNQKYSKQLEQIIFKAIEKKPAKRFQTIKELIAELQRVPASNVDLTETAQESPAQLESIEAKDGNSNQVETQVAGAEPELNTELQLVRISEFPDGKTTTIKFLEEQSRGEQRFGYGALVVAALILGCGVAISTFLPYAPHTVAQVVFAISLLPLALWYLVREQALVSKRMIATINQGKAIPCTLIDVRQSPLRYISGPIPSNTNRFDITLQRSDTGEQSKLVGMPLDSKTAIVLRELAAAEQLKLAPGNEIFVELYLSADDGKPLVCSLNGAFSSVSSA